MSRRVVVTGLGAISPVGNDVPTMWKNMIDGVCGIDEITAFDTSDLKVHIAGTVKGFEPEKYFEKREAKKLDIYCQYAIAAAQEAVDDSKILGTIDENRFGVYIGAGIGGLNTFVNNTIGLENGGPRKVSPFFIPMMSKGRFALGHECVRDRHKLDRRGVSRDQGRLRRRDNRRRRRGGCRSADYCRLPEYEGTFDQSRPQKGFASV